MKSFVLSLVLLAAVGMAGSMPAAAAVHNEALEASQNRSASLRDSGTDWRYRRLARATITDSWDTYYRNDRWSEESRPVTKRRTVRSNEGYTKRKSAQKSNRTSKHVAHAKSKKKQTTTARAPEHKAPTQRKAAIERRPKSLANEGPLGAVLSGLASFYWEPQRLATGGWFNPNAMTAAHKTLPFGTKVRVTHLGNGKSVDVKINDRGPYIGGRIIDLSKAAAGVLGMQNQGVAKVKVTVLGRE